MDKRIEEGGGEPIRDDVVIQAKRTRFGFAVGMYKTSSASAVKSTIFGVSEHNLFNPRLPVSQHCSCLRSLFCSLGYEDVYKAQGSTRRSSLLAVQGYVLMGMTIAENFGHLSHVMRIA
jgi:hypothetical protein